MRIAQVAPLYESVPPKLYGGTERVVSYLTEELVRQGHDVTLFASGDSVTSARLWPGSHEAALRLSGASASSALAQHLLMIERVAQQAYRFDIVHFHLDFMPFSVIRSGGFPAVTTLHGRQDLEGQFPLFREFDDMNLISISDAQRSAMPWANWIATVHHGLPADLYRPCKPQSEYLAFLGRISPEKRVDRAVEIARRAGMQLHVAAKVDDADREYFETVRGMLEEPHVDFINEIGDERQMCFPQQGGGLAVSHRLAGAVRPGDDRGPGVRNTGDRVSRRIGGGNYRRRRHRVYRGQRRGGRRSRRTASPRSIGASAALSLKNDSARAACATTTCAFTNA